MTQVEYFVDSFSDERVDGWTKIGFSPYLDAVDWSSRVYTKAKGDIIGDFGFEDSTLSSRITINSVLFQIYAQGDGNDGVEIHLFDGEGNESIFTLTPPTTAGWVSQDVSTFLNTVTKINNADFYMIKTTSGKANDLDVDAAKLTVDYTPYTDTKLVSDKLHVVLSRLLLQETRIETRYMRGETWTVNTITTNMFRLFRNDSPFSFSKLFFPPIIYWWEQPPTDWTGTAYIKYKVYKVTENGTKTLIATLTRGGKDYLHIFLMDGNTVYLSDTDSVPETPLNSTDAILIEVWGRVEMQWNGTFWASNYDLIASFITEQLGALTLKQAVWLVKGVFRGTIYIFQTPEGRYYPIGTIYYYVDDDYDSGIRNFRWTPIPALAKVQYSDGLVCVSVG